jgi:C4-dicarboxylate transporter DctQ subunit
MQEGIRRGLAKCESAMTLLAVWATFIIMGITTADAIGRYLFNQSISGVYEITEKYLMIVAVFMAACYGYRRGAYIRVTFFIDRLSRRARIVVDTFAQIFSILFGAFLVIASIKRAIYTIASGTILGTLNYPLWPGYIIVPVGLFFMSLLMLLDLPRMIRGKSSLSKEECHAGEHALDNKDEGD